MQPQTDYRQFAVLYVDDEEKSLASFTRAFGDDFRILTATNAQDGLKLLEQNQDNIGLLMTDQRMPGEKGVWLLERARQTNPHILRILATAYSDYEAAIAAVNTGAIYKFVSKPWDPPQLEQTLKRGLDYFILQRERDQLLREKMSVLRNMMIADRLVSLSLLAEGLSHHIRNPLQAVKTFLELAPAKMQEEKADVAELRDPGFWKEYYQSAQQQIVKIEGLLKELWSASEKAPTQFADQVQLHAVVAETIAGLRGALDAKQIQIENNIPATLPLLKVDKLKFSRLFELLLKDELASLPAGSRVTFTAETDSSGDRPEVCVRIADNGPGLPQEALSVLFDPFVVRSDAPAEYGIHLMACFFIVFHHGGKITASSTAGQGTTFTLQLPLDPERAVVENHRGMIQQPLLNEKLWQMLAAPE